MLGNTGQITRPERHLSIKSWRQFEILENIPEKEITLLPALSKSCSKNHKFVLKNTLLKYFSFKFFRCSQVWFFANEAEICIFTRYEKY